VLGEEREHVIKKRHAGVDLRLAGAIDDEFDLDVRFSRLAVLFRGAGCLHGGRI